MDQSNKERQFLSRRDALKALAAAGGAVALSMLPNKWEKPAVKVGTLPAFAQASPVAGTATLQVTNVEDLTLTLTLSGPMTDVQQQNTVEYGSRDFAPGTWYWYGIPPGWYFYAVTGCLGASIPLIYLPADVITPLTIGCDFVDS